MNVTRDKRGVTITLDAVEASIIAVGLQAAALQYDADRNWYEGERLFTAATAATRQGGFCAMLAGAIDEAQGLAGTPSTSPPNEDDAQQRAEIDRHLAYADWHCGCDHDAGWFPCGERR